MRLLIAIPTLLAAGCIFSRESAPPGLDSAVVQHATATQSWSLVARGVEVGTVVRFESVLGEERFFFVVRNRHGQDLGFVDALGRAYRRRPFQDEDEWIGSGTVLDGARRILGLAGPVEMIEAAVPAPPPTE